MNRSLIRATYPILAPARMICLALDPKKARPQVKASKRTYYLSAEGRISTNKPQGDFRRVRACNAPEARKLFAA